MQTRGVNVGFEAALARRGIELSSDPSLLSAISGDFGRIARGHPLGVIRARDEGELQTVVEVANSFDVRLTLRGAGNSQSGQSLADHSYCLGLSALESSVRVDPDNQTALCSASSSWGHVVEAGARHGLVPKVVPLNLDLTIGGTLSAGGIGASSHRYGSAGSNVLGLTAVTGAGERVTSSRTSRPEVLDAVIAGLGRAAVLTSATLSLRAAARRVHTVYALYSSLGNCLADMRFLAAQAACSYIEGSCAACVQGLMKTTRGRQPLFRWFFGIQFSVEYDAASVGDLQPILDGLRCFEIVHREDDEHQSFLDRYRARIESMRRSGAWDQPHPWFECFLPFDSAAPFIEETLASLPATLGDGHRLFAIDGASNPKYLQLPVDSTNTSLAFTLLPTGVPASSLPSVLEFVERTTERLHATGGKRYMSGWLGACDGEFWRRHQEGFYDEWAAVKRTLDPRGVLTSVLFSNDAA